MKIRLIQKIKYDILSSHECLVTLGYFENVEPSKFLRETGAGNILLEIATFLSTHRDMGFAKI